MKLCIYIVLIGCVCTSELIAQQEPSFTLFKGKVYSTLSKNVKYGYGEHVYDGKVIGEVEWDEINIPDRDTEEGFPDVEKKSLFGMVLYSTLEIPENSCYEFVLNSDDGSKLWIQDVLLIDNDGDHKMTEMRDTILLSPGNYDVKLWYQQAYPNRYGFIFNSSNVGKICKKKLVPEHIAKQTSFILNEEVYFDIDKYVIKPSAIKNLDSICNILNQQNFEKIFITGHTDSDGGYQYNITLSDNRAHAIKHHLISKLIDPDILYYTKGLGEEVPYTSNATIEGRSLNRRVEIRIE